MGKYEFDNKTYEFYYQYIIANELAESNRLKRIELECNFSECGEKIKLEDKA